MLNVAIFHQFTRSWHAVDRRNPAPVEFGSLPQYLQGFLDPRWLAGFLPSTLLRPWPCNSWQLLGRKIMFESDMKQPIWGMFVHGCVCICLFNVCLCRYLTFTALIYECSVCTHSCFQSALNILQGRNKNPCIIVAATSRGLSNAERRPCRVQRHCHAGNGVVEEVQLSRWSYTTSKLGQVGRLGRQ